MRGLLQDYSGKLVDRRNPNLTPLIDVVFQLILFFLVTSSFIWYSGMKVKLPEASSDIIDRPLETITLEIKSANDSSQPERLIVRWWEESIEGVLFWPPQKEPTAGLADLKSELEVHKRGLEEDRKPSVVIAAEDSIPYQIVITVIDMCEQLGFSDIVLATQKRVSNNQT
jgi:biopolymer transport protein ExbD